MHRSLTGTEAGLVAYYRMDEGSGTATADATGHGYTATMGGGSQAPAWVPAGEPLGTPAVTTLAATSVTNASATLNGTVNPEAQSTGAWFQWGTNSSYGNTTAVTNVGSATTNVPLSAGLSGLVLGANYSYQLIATNSSGSSTGSVAGFTIPALPPTIASPLATNVSAFNAMLEALVDPRGAATTVFFAYGTNLPYAFTNKSSLGGQPGPVLVTNRLGPLQPGALYHFEIFATNSAGTTSGSDQTFLAAGPPQAFTASADGITPSGTAVLHGSAFPNGADTTAWFQWGTNTFYGSNTPLTVVSGTNFGSAQVSNVVAGLAPAIVYHFQLVATNSLGTNLGGDSAFAVPGPPVVVSELATSSSLTNATLFASIQSSGLDTTAWFQYGTTTNYGSITGSTVVGGSNVTAVLVSNLVNGLSVGTLYHFRAVATNAAGTAYGPDQTFTTVFFVQLNTGLPGLADGEMVWGDYDNDGRLDVLVTGFNAANVPVTQVYRNNGAGLSDIGAGLTGVRFSSGAWGDYDNDGRLDVVFSGRDSSGNSFSQVWHNTPTGFTNLNAGLPGNPYNLAWGDYDNDGRLDLLLSSDFGDAEMWHNTANGFSFVSTLLQYGANAVWGDYDNDGRLDILVSGLDSHFNPTTQVWRNTGNGFSNINAGLPPITGFSMAWGDYDNDGWLDILLAGYDNSGAGYVQVWRNTGSGFTNINAGLPGLVNGSVVWGDFDNDGRLDILLAGGTMGAGPSGGHGITQIWRNTGNGFTNVGAALSAVYSGSAAWGDFDNDGRLDVLVCGASDSPPYFIGDVWHNLWPVTNTPPTAPTGLSATPNGTAVTLNWNAATDAQTPSSGLSYNIRVGSVPGGIDIVGPQADPVTGFRRVPALGNAQMNRFALVSSLAPGTYYWSVQAIDTAFAGSPFAPEQKFTVGGPTVVTGPTGVVTSASAVLTGTVAPNGADAWAWFEWGASPVFGSNTPPVFMSQTNVAPVALSNLVNGLTPLTQYYYRLTASNNVSRSFGAGLAFVTAPVLTPTIGSALAQPGNSFVFPCLGAPGVQYTLQASTDLVTWSVVTNVTADSLGHFQFSTGTSNYPVRFFRLSWP